MNTIIIHQYNQEEEVLRNVIRIEHDATGQIYVTQKGKDSRRCLSIKDVRDIF